MRIILGIVAVILFFIPIAVVTLLGYLFLPNDVGAVLCLAGLLIMGMWILTPVEGRKR